MTGATHDKEPAVRRIPAIDMARGLALIAMAIYHFTWDLQFFGFLEPGTATAGGWKMFARCIASSFLILVGVGLVLAHGQGFRRSAFWARWLQIVGASLLITAATLYATPDSFVFFGILHHIAVASVLGLPFVRLPAWVGLLVAATVFVVGQTISSPSFDNAFALWIGLAAHQPLSNDYVPVFPWFSAVLAGIGLWKLGVRLGIDRRLAQIGANGTSGRLLGYLGRHSLAFYLLHQPLLIGLVGAFAWVFPPDGIATQQRAFLAQCQESCETTRDADFCLAYCGCFLNALEADGSLGDIFSDPGNPGAVERMQQVTSQCSAQTDLETRP